MQSWQDITEDYLLKVEGDGGIITGVQFVFSGEEEGREFLMDNGGRNLEVFGFRGQEFQAWLQQH
jgi:hypothetical protein